MKTRAILAFGLCCVGSFAAQEGHALPLRTIETDIIYTPTINANLSRYYTTDEIATYNRALAVSGTSYALSGAGEENRLLDAAGNRCGNDQLPVAQCPQYQTFAYNAGNGCINATEYNYARTHAIAPLCSPFDRTVYVGWCRCGCFEETTVIAVFDRRDGSSGDVAVPKVKTGLFELFTMAENATLANPKFDRHEVSATTVGLEAKPLVWVHLSDGTALGLTEEHAVLLSSGEMVAAKSLKAGRDQLVKKSGEFVSIASIDRKLTKRPVYNVLTNAGLSHKGHMIIANGTIVGDIMWQNTLASDLKKVVVRM